MARVGIVLHGEDERALLEAERLAGQLIKDGHEVVAAVEDASRLSEMNRLEVEDFPAGLDLAVSLGGDGTMLRTVAQLKGADVDILGVNFGDLGYLTVTEPHGLDQAIARWLSGDYKVEERMLVAGTVGGSTFHALNDIVVERAPGTTTIRLRLTIDGKPFTSYPADGVIVSTPTGSTAYALSARGPIVYPTHSAIQVTPVSPHTLFDRSLVLRPDALVELTLVDHRQAVVSVDGNTMHTMDPGETIVCTQSVRTAKLITFDRRDNLAVLKAKLGLPDR